MIGLNWLDPRHMLVSLGAWALVAVLAIVFAECGLLIGFFLPGDSLLFISGLFVATRPDIIDTNIAIVCALISIAAVAGNLTGYWIGRKAGPAVFRRPDSRLFRREYVDHTQRFFDRHGPRAIVLARFVPIVRTFITVMAGGGRMKFRTYAVYSTIGGILWGTGVTLLGYYLGNVAFIANHIEVILIGVVAVSLIPIFWEVRRHTSTGSDTSTGSGGN